MEEVKQIPHERSSETRSRTDIYVGGVPEIITDGFNGFLIAPGDPSNLSQKIEELLNNEHLRKSFIENGFKAIRRKFSSERQFSSMFSYLIRLSGK